MRNVVAESLGALLEPVDVNRIPLPDSYDALFELICIVRILKALVPRPNAIQWLDNFGGDNVCRLSGIEAFIQRHFRREILIGSTCYPPELIRTIQAQNISLPERADGIVLFERMIADFNGIIIEAKSGNQKPGDTILQLLSYSEAIRKERPGRYLVWGIVENSSEIDSQARSMLSQEMPHDGNYWIFTTEDRIGEVMQRLGLMAESRNRQTELKSQEIEVAA